MRDDGETPPEVFAGSCDWFAYKLLATPRLQRSSDADAADELSVSLNGNQRDEDRDEGDECFTETGHVDRIFSDAGGVALTLTVYSRSKSQKKENVRRQKSVHGRSATSK